MLINVHGQPITSQKREITIRNPKVAKFAAYADDVFRQLNLTVVCTTCGQTPQMNNAMTDTQWRMECACTQRLLDNPGVH